MITTLILSVALSFFGGAPTPNAADVGGGIPTVMTSSAPDVGGGIPTVTTPSATDVGGGIPTR